MIDRNTMDGPIPGENFMADTRNYPWHRPPEYDHPDKFLAYTYKTFKRPHTMGGLETLLSSGVTVTTMTDMFLSRSIMDGLITVDFAIMLAGPVAKAIELMAVQLGVDYEMGFEDTAEIPTKENVQRLARIIEEDFPQAEEEDLLGAEEPVAEEEAPSVGLMAPEADLLGEPADKKTQDTMLGLIDEEEPADELQ